MQLSSDQIFSLSSWQHVQNTQDRTERGKIVQGDGGHVRVSSYKQQESLQRGDKKQEEEAELYNNNKETINQRPTDEHSRQIWSLTIWGESNQSENSTQTRGAGHDDSLMCQSADSFQFHLTQDVKGTFACFGNLVVRVRRETQHFININKQWTRHKWFITRWCSCKRTLMWITVSPPVDRQSCCPTYKQIINDNIVKHSCNNLQYVDIEVMIVINTVHK